MWKIVRCSIFILFKMPFGVALSAPPSSRIACVNSLCSSCDQRRRSGFLTAAPSPSDSLGAAAGSDSVSTTVCARTTFGLSGRS